MPPRWGHTAEHRTLVDVVVEVGDGAGPDVGDGLDTLLTTRLRDELDEVVPHVAVDVEPAP